MSEVKSDEAQELPSQERAQAELAAGGRVDVGQQLSLARQAHGLSVAELAQVLKLSPHQIEAIEANDWSNLPESVSRGFVRNYARFFNIDAEPFMAALNDSKAMPPRPELRFGYGETVSMPREGGHDRKDLLRILAGLLVLIAAVIAYLFVPVDAWRSSVQWLKGLTQRVEATAAAGKPAASTHAAASDDPLAPAAASSTAPESAVAVPSPSPAAASSSAPDPVAPPEASTASATPTSDGPARLEFSFAQQSWVEVRDRDGAVLFSQLNPAGSQREVSGQPPFSVVAGNASGVTLKYRGAPVDLSKRSKDNVARLTLE